MASVNTEPIDKLLDYLRSIASGPISDAAHLEELLAGCWDEFSGSDAERMTAHKLGRGMEDVVWEPPILRFTIERHGATDLGSTRAELQGWELDLCNRAATCGCVGHRQLQPMQPRLDVRPMAEKIAGLIVKRQYDERLKWNDDGSVRVLIGKILPEDSAVKQTLEGRRRRFRKAVEERLSNSGWSKIRANVYAPPAR